MTYYAIADLHGRYDILRDSINAIEKHAANSDNTRIITLGDYIDRGPESNKIIEYLMKHPNITCLKGNHEDIMLQTYDTPLSKDWWFSNGGYNTYVSYFGDPDASHLSWCRSLPVFLETPRHVFVHAGVPADDLDLKDQSEERLMWMLYAKDDHGGYRDKHVVHGHHIHEDGPKEWNRRTALDTGSFFTNRQVIGVFDDTQGRAIDFLEIKV